MELPLPDADRRRRLLKLYSRGLSVEGVQLDRFVGPTEGATPAYIKELLRKATLRAIEAGSGTIVRAEHLDGALEELSEGGRLAERILGFKPDAAGREHRPTPGLSAVMPTGFPTRS